MADELVQFVPAGEPSADQDRPSFYSSSEQHQLRDNLRDLRPDMPEQQFDAFWAGFLAMRERVDNPRRRIGGDVRRRGPVLFPPCHHVRSAPDE